MGGTRIRVLVADDHTVMRRVLKHVLNRSSDMEVVAEAANAAEVFKQLENTHPDVLLLDINMPEMSGLQVLKKLRSEKNNIPVVILTLFSQERLKDAALRSGASYYLTKDCASDQLIDAIRSAV